eukprot:12910582-Prorocentrum_lima.AAC.1
MRRLGASVFRHLGVTASWHLRVGILACVLASRHCGLPPSWRLGILASWRLYNSWHLDASAQRILPTLASWRLGILVSRRPFELSSGSELTSVRAPGKPA